MGKVNPKITASLPLQIREDIGKKIVDGRLLPGERIPSEEKLASEYGVSRMTARQAIVELVMQGALYRVPGKGTFVSSNGDEGEKSLATRGFVTLIVPNLTNSFLYEVIRGVERCVTRSRFEVHLRSANEDALEERQCIEALPERVVRGIILIARKYSHTNSNLFSDLSRKIPVVVVDVAVPGLEVDLVVSDDRQGAFLVTNHLIELGHKGILHLAGPEGDSSAEERLSGYSDALRNNGIELSSELVRRTEWRSEDGYHETKKFFLNSKGENKTTAIFACDDEVAAGAFKALTELGLKVPGDVGLAGYGNLDIGRFLGVPLTSVNQFPTDLGKIAGELLLEKVSGKRALAENKIVRVPTKLVIRESCGIKSRIENFRGEVS